MALFSTLVSSSGDESKPSIPTVIQLCTSNNAMIVVDPTAPAAEHAVLSYQAIEVGQESSTGEAALFGHKRKSIKSLNQNPNLGVWNCRVSENALVDQLLGVPNNNSNPTFCFTVDLKDPTQVERTVSVLQESLVRHLIQNPPSSTTSTTATTSLYQLRSAQFGLAAQDDSNEKSAPDVADKKVVFSLMICAIVPRSSSLEGSDAYKQKQAQVLLFYHLRRYAASLQATLCLVRSGSGSDAVGDETPQGGEEKGKGTELPTMTVDQVSHAWLQLARGEAVVEEKEETKEQEDTAAYGPGTQEDLIETVLLRNAHCQGEWDASKDSLWVALPPVKSEHDKVVEHTNKTGDEVWLSQLRESLGSLLATANEPASAATEATTTDSQDKPQEKEDAAVSSFFENLLKKP